MHKYQILLVSDNVDQTLSLKTGLLSLGAEQVHVSSIDDNVLKNIGNQSIDLIVLDVKKPTTQLFEKFSVVNEYCPMPMICFSEERDSKIIQKSVQAGVTAYIVDGKAPERLKPIIEVAMARFKECQAVKKELAQVKDKLAQRAVIEKAKGLLVEYRKMSEDQAYHTMRKMAMDQGKKISVIAGEIVDVIEGLSRQEVV